MRRSARHTDFRSRQSLAAAVAMTLAVLYCVGLLVTAFASEEGAMAQAAVTEYVAMDYENSIFDASFVHTIDIQIDPADWEHLKDTMLYKEYHDCNVVIDGETVYHVGVRPKGNSTLLQSALRNWDRQSLVLNFAEYNTAQRYDGLDKLALYNNACDSSFLKVVTAFDMMRSMGLPTPLTSYAAVSLNGEYVGLYVAIEVVDESFAIRNFGYDHGILYKPEQFDVAGIVTGTSRNAIVTNFDAIASGETLSASSLFAIPTDAVALKYLGEELSAYDDIWYNTVFDCTTADKKRLVSAIKTLGSEDAADVVDMEQLASYFAVSAFVLNNDGYLTDMAHNYYLYEEDGKLHMLPWDYDLSLGAMGAVGEVGSSTEFINTPIDEPFINTTLEERPMFAALMNSQEGRMLYYDALREFLDSYIFSGYLEDFIDRQAGLIEPYVHSDPTKLKSNEQWSESVKALKQFCSLRAQSIQGQLDGAIPSTLDGQRAQPQTLVDASGFVSPDSSNLMEMLFPSDSGMYLEEAIGNLMDKTSLTAVIKSIPAGGMPQMEGEAGLDMETMMADMVEQGLVKDPDALSGALMKGILDVVRDLLVFALSFVALAIGLIWIYRYEKPRKKKGGAAHGRSGRQAPA